MALVDGRVDERFTINNNNYCYHNYCDNNTARISSKPFPGNTPSESPSITQHWSISNRVLNAVRDGRTRIRANGLVRSAPAFTFTVVRKFHRFCDYATRPLVSVRSNRVPQAYKNKTRFRNCPSHNLLSELSTKFYNSIHSSSSGFYAPTTVNPFHSKLNNTMYKAHPNIHQLIEALNDVQTDTHIKLPNTIKKKGQCLKKKGNQLRDDKTLKFNENKISRL